jgi:hypothetical protein
VFSLLAAQVADVDPNIVIPASFTALAAIIVALIAHGRTRPRADAPTAPPTATVPPSPLADFSGTQNEFMALVVQDSKELRRQLAQLRQDAAADVAQARREAAAEAAETRAVVAAMREERTLLERAITRYLEFLAGEWPGPGTMPGPAVEDLGILAQTIPPRRHRRT